MLFHESSLTSKFNSYNKLLFITDNYTDEFGLLLHLRDSL